MQNSTKILLGIFVVSLLVIVFGGDMVASTEPALGASAAEIQKHLFSITIPFALVNLALLLSTVLLIIRGISHYFGKAKSAA